MKLYKWTLTRIVNGSSLRTDSVIGVSYVRPLVGHQFILFGESIDPDGSVRRVQTSLVKSIEQPNDDTYIIHTENSTYLIEATK